MRQAKLGQHGIEREAERLKTLLNLGWDVLTDDLGGVDWTTTNTGSWEDTGLSLTVTPTRNVHCLALFKGLLKHSVALANVQGAIVKDGAAVSATIWTELTQAANKWWAVNVWALAELVAGTSYTIKFQLRNGTAGTLTLYGLQAYTELAVILAHKAVLV